jgi:hypothetical protein
MAISQPETAATAINYSVFENGRWLENATLFVNPNLVFRPANYTYSR